METTREGSERYMEPRLGKFILDECCLIERRRATSWLLRPTLLKRTGNIRSFRFLMEQMLMVAVATFALSARPTDLSLLLEKIKGKNTGLADTRNDG